MKNPALHFYLSRVIAGMLVIGNLNQLSSQPLTREEIKELSAENLPNAIGTLVEFLAIPNESKAIVDIHRNLTWCITKFHDLGFTTEVLYADSVPHLLATRPINKKLPTLLFYLQIDGQPVDGSKWDQGNPYQATFKRATRDGFEVIPNPEFSRLKVEDRIFARSASDSKGPAIAFITALDILKRNKISSQYNLKVILDFQEEIGSPTLPDLVRSKKDLFKADAILIMDGTRHVSNLPTLTFGARGLATITLKVFGPKDNLHSGQYGNYAPNPAFGLAQLLAGMKDENGRVLIPGFYDAVEISAEERTALRIEQEDEAALIKQLGIAKPEVVGTFYQEALQYPSLNIRGLRAAWVGAEVRTIIPAEALAEIDIRLVPETPAESQVALVKQYIQNQGYFLVEGEPSAEQRAQHQKLASFTYRIGSKPFRTEINSTLGNWLGACLHHVYDNNYVRMQLTGGSQPMEPFITALSIPAVSVRIPNPDNNIHGPNENIRIGNFLEGIEMCLSILTHRYP